MMNQSDLTRALLAASEDGSVETLEKLLGCGTQGVDTCDERYRITPLQTAAANGHTEAVRVLVMRGARLDLANCHGWTALMQAARHGHISVVALLLQSKADVHARTRLGASALHMAAAGGHHKICQLILESGCEPAASTVRVGCSSYEHTPLMCASQCGHDDIVRYLLNNRADIKYRAPSTGINSLMLAALNGHMTTAQMLVERGADPDHTDINGETPLSIAVVNDKREVKGYLERKTRNIPKQVKAQDRLDIIEAVKSGDYKQLCEILRLDGAKQKDVVSHKEGATPLMFAAMTGQLDAVKSLHQVNCDLDKQDTISGWTALMQATYHGNSDVACYLINAGADVQLQAYNGCTAFDMATLIDDIDTELYRLLASRAVQDVIPQDMEESGSGRFMSSAFSEPNLADGPPKSSLKAWWSRMSNRFRHLKLTRTFSKTPKSIPVIEQNSMSSTSHEKPRRMRRHKSMTSENLSGDHIQSQMILTEVMESKDFQMFKTQTLENASVYTLQLNPGISTLEDGGTLKPVIPPFLPPRSFDERDNKTKMPGIMESRSPKTPLDPTMRRPKYKSNFLKYSSRGNLNNLSPPGSNRNSYCDQSPSSSGSAGMLSAITSKTTTHTAGISSASSSTLTAGSDHYRTAGHYLQASDRAFRSTVHSLSGPSPSGSKVHPESARYTSGSTTSGSKYSARKTSQGKDSSKGSNATLTPPDSPKVHKSSSSQHISVPLPSCSQPTTTAIVDTNAHASPSDDLHGMLKELELEQYQPIFEEQEVDMEAFLMLSEEDLKELGISKEESVKQIVTVINQLKTGKGRERLQFHETLTSFQSTMPENVGPGFAKWAFPADNSQRTESSAKTRAS